MKAKNIYQNVKTLKDYQTAAQDLSTIIDFYRFSLSLANVKELYFGHGCDNVEDDLAYLILGSLNLAYDSLERYGTAQLTVLEKNSLIEKIHARIEKRIPVPYLINKAYFCGLEFYVDERVLIPRSPIAECIEAQFMPWINPDEVSHILDLCTGSACIAAALAYAFPEAQVDAIDIDAQALELAAYNIERLGLTEHVRLLQSDMLSGLKDEQYDIIVSNPPYVGDEEMQTLPSEYAYEPRHALEAGDNGLYLVHQILKNAKKHLKPHGILVVEVGNSDLALIEAYPDLPFVWLEFARGGHGVFLLTAEDLRNLT